MSCWTSFLGTRYDCSHFDCDQSSANYVWVASNPDVGKKIGPTNDRCESAIFRTRRMIFWRPLPPRFGFTLGATKFEARCLLLGWRGHTECFPAISAGKITIGAGVISICTPAFSRAR